MPVSALDAISPAFARTKLVLYTPFRLGRTWKLSISAYLTMGSAFFMPLFLLAFFFVPQMRSAGGSTLVTAVLISAVVLTLFFTWVFYLLTRLRFAVFDIVIDRGEFITPAWRKHGSAAWSFTLFKFVLGLVITAALALPSIAFYKHLFATLAAMPKLQPGQQLPPDVAFSILGGYLSFYAILGGTFWLTGVLNDLLIAPLALRNATLGEAFRELFQFIRDEPGQVALYAVMKLVLAVAGYMAVTFASEIALLLVIVVVGLVVGLIGFGLHLAGVSTVILTVLAILVGVAFYIALLWGMMFPIGALFTYLEAYMAYFLAGRYPAIRERLIASTPVPATASPLYPNPYPPYVPPSPAE